MGCLVERYMLNKMVYLIDIGTVLKPTSWRTTSYLNDCPVEVQVLHSVAEMFVSACHKDRQMAENEVVFLSCLFVFDSAVNFKRLNVRNKRMCQRPLVSLST